jgi:hypothetical protein
VGTPQWNTYYQDRLGEMVSLLASRGAHVVMATIPQYMHGPARSQAEAKSADPGRVGALDAAYRSFAAAHPDVVLYDLASQVTQGDLVGGPALTRSAIERMSGTLDIEMSMLGNPTLALPPGRVPSPTDPLRVIIIGDSVMQDAAPGVTAALQATGVIRVVDNDARKYWGLTTVSTWRTEWPHLVAEYRPEVVLGMWAWDMVSAKSDPVGYGRLVQDAIGLLMAPGSSVDGVAIVEFPRSHPNSTIAGPTQPQTLADLDRATGAWNSVMASIGPQWPGRYLYLPVASSLEVGGQYSAWLPGPGGVESRARKTDNFHLCPTGAARLGQALVDGLTPTLNLPNAAPGWWTGSWTKDPTYNDPPGSCPDDHP